MVLGSVSSVLGVVFLLAPELKPEPRARVAGELQILQVDRDIAWGEYLDRTEQNAGPCDPPDARNRLGQVIYVRLETTGFRRRRTQLRWSVFRGGRSRVANPYYRNKVAFDNEATVDRAVYAAWVPLPPDRNEYRIRFELLSDRGEDSTTDPSRCELADQRPTGGSGVPLAMTETKRLRGQKSVSLEAASGPTDK